MGGTKKKQCKINDVKMRSSGGKESHIMWWFSRFCIRLKPVQCGEIGLTCGYLIPKCHKGRVYSNCMKLGKNVIYNHEWASLETYISR